MCVGSITLEMSNNPRVQAFSTQACQSFFQHIFVFAISVPFVTYVDRINHREHELTFCGRSSLRVTPLLMFFFTPEPRRSRSPNWSFRK